MSQENQSPRSISDIQSEYQNLCLKAGHTQYQIDALSKDLQMLNSSLRDLNLEAASLQASQKPSGPVAVPDSSSIENQPEVQG